jgi:AraC-like DNA-binding protein
MIIGFAGKIGVGKTTTAEWFVKNHNWARLAYGDPIKVALVEFTGLPMKNFTDPYLKEQEIDGLPGISARIMMQKLGTEYARNMIYQDYFLWRMRQAIEANCHKHIVIDDVRFANEAQLIRDLGGSVFHLYRDFETLTEQTSHASENSIDFDESRDRVVQCLQDADTTAAFIFSLL